MNSNTQRIEYFEGKNNTPKLSFERDEKTDLQVSVLEEDNQELPVWTLQSQKSISQKQTVYGLDAGEKYQILVESDIFEVKIADANGSLSFSLNLTGGQKTLITLAVE